MAERNIEGEFICEENADTEKGMVIDMKYGYFDETKREYVITRPDTPAPWANYLGSPEYGSIISNNAGGYSFVKSGAKGRITRYIFNQEDKPGRYIYLRDDEDGDYWSASWQPVLKPLGEGEDGYQNECRHGMAYTTIAAKYHKIQSEVLFYVPLNKTYEVFRVKLTNNDTKKRSISAFGFVEFTNESFYENDQVNLQYTQFITKTYFEGNSIVQTINENTPANNRGEGEENERFFALLGSKVTSYNGDKEAFIGRYHSYNNPVAVMNGSCNNQLNYNGNACGALQTKLELNPGETKEFMFVLGRHKKDAREKIYASYQKLSVVDQELETLRNYWHEKLDHLKVKTPSEEFNVMVNTWNAYQCFITFIWSRAASFTYCGLRNGYGYRDTVQDIQGIIHLDPAAAKEKITFMLSAQVNNGGGLPLVKYTHTPGKEDTPDDASYVQETGHPAYRADDALWLFPTVYKYIAETGDTAYLQEVIPYANKEEGTVYDHLKRAIKFSMDRLGVHQMPVGLYADWNDCLRLGAKGESTFVAMQLYLAMNILKEFSTFLKDTEYLAYLEEKQTVLGASINENCWEGDRFIRGFTEEGAVIGSKNDPEANMWLNPQSFGVISGLSTKEQAEKSLNEVEKQLNTKYGVRLMTPSYVNHSFDGARMILFNPSTKENGGIFSQSQGWIVLAESLTGHGNRAFTYFMENAPAAQNEIAEIRCLEPYTYGQFVESVESPFEGRAHVHWLTGTASTMMVGCVEGILGIRPDLGGIRLAPSIPSSFKEFEIEKVFRGKKLKIKVSNPNGAENGYQKFVVNGEEYQDNYIPAEKMLDVNEIEIVM